MIDLDAHLKTAMKAKDPVAVTAYRSLKSKVLLKLSEAGRPQGKELTEEEFAAGRAAAQKAAALGASTARERDYIAAIGAYYQGDGVAHPARVAAYEKAMAGVAERNRADDEAAIFHALSILGVAYNSPPDKTYARQKEAAKILNRLLAVEPDHPGIAHYMIHSFDYPELA